MFDNLSSRFESILKKVRGKGRLTEADVDEVLGEIRAALLDAPERIEGSPSVSRALRFVTRIGTARGTSSPGVGLGEELHLETTKMVGQALVLDGAVVHASAFALAA